MTRQTAEETRSREEMLLEQAMQAGEAAKRALQYQRRVQEELRDQLAEQPMGKVDFVLQNEQEESS